MLRNNLIIAWRNLMPPSSAHGDQPRRAGLAAFAFCLLRLALYASQECADV